MIDYAKCCQGSGRLPSDNLQSILKDLRTDDVRPELVQNSTV